MNALHLTLFAGLALASVQASAHPPGPPGAGHQPPTTQVPQPLAPSMLPYEAYRYDDYPYVIDRERYEYDTRGPCIAQDTSKGASRETSESTESSENATPHAIDWCALAPYQPRYAPQIPASWWWHHRAPWRYGRTR